MKTRITSLIFAVLLTLASVGIASADPTAPTTGGSANGNGASGQCTGPEAQRPPSCHNGKGSGN